MKIDNRFATKIKDMDEIPEPFRRQLRKLFTPDERISLLVYAPAYTSVGDRRFPATVLAVADQRWVIVEDQADGSSRVSQAAFEDTLLLELTEVLLFGRLKIDFASNGETRSSTAQFNTSMDKLYQEAVEVVLNGMEGLSPFAQHFVRGRSPGSPSSDWPLKFKNDILKVIPHGRQLLAAAAWPAVNAGFRRELAPAAALAVTETEMILVSDPPAGHWFVAQEDNKYGRVVTYFPLARLGQHRIVHHEQFGVLELEVRASHGGEKLQIIFPSSHESEVSDLMDLTFTATHFGARFPKL